MTDLPAIAANLATALRRVRCTCITREHWPWKKPLQCSRCEALAQYDAMQSTGDKSTTHNQESVT